VRFLPCSPPRSVAPQRRTGVMRNGPYPPGALSAPPWYIQFCHVIKCLHAAVLPLFCNIILVQETSLFMTALTGLDHGQYHQPRINLRLYLASSCTTSRVSGLVSVCCGHQLPRYSPLSSLHRRPKYHQDTVALIHSPSFAYIKQQP